MAPACGSDEQNAGYAPLRSDPDAAADASPTDTGIEWPDASDDAGGGPGPSPSFDAAVAEAGVKDCSSRVGAKGRRNIRVLSGVTRTALLNVPQTYDSSSPTSLVLNFHGFGSAGWQQEILSRMSDAAEQRGIIVVYPDGIASSWNAGDCCGTAWSNSVDDVGFARDLIEQLEAEYCIDPQRVYATGMSNGGFMSYRLACELSDRIAAIAPVAGVLGLSPALCRPSRPVPVLHFHGTADALVPYRGGSPLVGTLGSWFRSVEETLTFWRAQNVCSARGEVFFQNGDASCTRFKDCAGFLQTGLCTIDQGGHTWPGGVPIPLAGKTSTSIDATEAMLDFFAAHHLP